MLTAALAPSALSSRQSDDPTRILSRAESEAIYHRVLDFLPGGGDIAVTIRSTWTASLRWARNRPTTSGETLDHTVVITRQRDGITAVTEVNQLDDAALRQGIQTLGQQPAPFAFDGPPGAMLAQQQYAAPVLWDEATYTMTARERSTAARLGVTPVTTAQLDAAGNLRTCAATWAVFNTQGLAAYAAATGAVYSETVRTPAGDGSGWAGKSHVAWMKLDAPTLAARALEKCSASAHPVAIEPGRYTAILEPDAVAPLLYQAIGHLDRGEAHTANDHPFHNRLGTQILDSRITISTDPMDPDGGYMPFDPEGYPYRRVNWVENGVLTNMAYSRGYAHNVLGTEDALPNPLAFRVSGGDTTIEEMIATTKRGILVTDFGTIDVEDNKSLSLVGTTRNGLWLIENGSITHPIKNLWIYESPLTVFNKILALGPPVRVMGRMWGGDSSGGDGEAANLSLPSCATNGGLTPLVLPPIKVEDFNFTRLSDAI